MEATIKNTVKRAVITKPAVTIQIDPEDLHILNEFNWLNVGTEHRPYIARNDYKDGHKRVLLSEQILNKFDGRIVFINGNSLDYRKENLRCKKTEVVLMGDYSILKVQQKGETFDVLIDNIDLHLLGQKEWFISSYNYLLRKETVNGKRKDIFFHRLVLDCPDDLQVDHIDTNRLDNRRHNLRICTVQENSCNKGKRSKVNDYKGISETRHGRFKSLIGCNGSRFDFGSFETEREAAMVYDYASNILHKEFANNNNLPDELSEEVKQKIRTKLGI